MDIRLYIALLLYFASAVFGETETDRKDKLVSVFQVVKFKNDVCTGATKNGTCYTSAECDNLGGLSSGTCADGFGVCCIITLAIDGSSSQNNTYITADNTIAAGAHTYTVCPCNDNICRIKFDFTSFQLAAPDSGYGFVTNAAPVALNAAAVGRCLIDDFTIISPSGRNSPQICGNNANQHMILDAAGSECLTVNANIGTGTSGTTRALDIKVTQYTCGDEMGGPTGCLQYYTNTVGKIRSFNFPDTTPGAAITAGFAVHLHDQHYKICIRQGIGNEVICYIPCTNIVGVNAGASGNIPTNQPSFGLSANEIATEATNLVDTACSTDYIWIRPGTDIATQFTTAISAQDAIPDTTVDPQKFCGRYWGTTTPIGTGFIDASVCSYGVPFEVGVNFDESDVCVGTTDLATCESLTEQNANVNGGSGNLGFSLCYIQQTPPFT